MSWIVAVQEVSRQSISPNFGTTVRVLSVFSRLTGRKRLLVIPRQRLQDGACSMTEGGAAGHRINVNRSQHSEAGEKIRPALRPDEDFSTSKSHCGDQSRTE